MESEGQFSDVEFDLLGMLFPGDGPYTTCTPFSQYSTGDDDRICGRTDFEVAANASVTMPGFDEDYSYCSLVNIVDPVFPWNGGFCVPTADFSGVVANNTRVPTANEIPPKEDSVAAGQGLKHKRKFVTSAKSADNAFEITETSKKRPRQYRVKRQEGAKTRKNKKPTDVVGKNARDNDKNGECNDNVIGRQDGQSPASSCSSEVDLNSRQLSGSNDIKDDSSAPLNNMTAAEVKPRASRGVATDPQSLYARRRRERINERLKILQNLIPNGTKVDISTMLEEAVHYVKFLQIQIKLLSSDELWMYAPIAYYGKDIGLNLNQLFSSQPYSRCCSYQA